MTETINLVIKGNVIDAVSDTVIMSGAVAVSGERIVYVGPAEALTAPPEADVVMAETILPGFIDCHAHLVGTEDAGEFAGGKFFGDQLMGAAFQAGLLLDSGFTGIRDMSEAGLYLSRAEVRGVLRSPRIFPGGRILGITSGHVDLDPQLTKAEINRSDRLTRLCDGPDDCVLAVREQFRMGAKFIKICATGGVSSPTDRVDDIQFSPAELRAIVEEAKRHHTYVAAHCTGNEGAYQALLAGVTSIEHGVMLTEREVELMAEMDATLVSTLAVSLGVAKFPDLPFWMAEKAKMAAEANLHTIEIARRAGIRIAFGSDYSNSKNTPYKKLGREFEAMTEAGLTPLEAIRAGTINGAYLMGADAETGSLAAGKLADIVLVQGNPLEDIACLGDADRITAVYKAGRQMKAVTV